MNATHTVSNVNGSKRTCEVLEAGPILSTIRLNTACYWEAPRFETRVVQSCMLSPFPPRA